VPTRMTPPTFYRLNKFTRGFQNLVESYGVADYLEVNPSPYTIITFPFLFAVMFGDAGHGLIMFLVALWMVMFERKLAATAAKNEMFGMIFSGRYIILLMGLFSIYTGLIYNDVFSKSLTIFPPGWSCKNISDETINSSIKGVEFKKIGLDPRNSDQFIQAYWFGLDPIWTNALNKLQFVNAIKMKMAVILGLAQMLFGLFLALVNHIHFKKMVNIYGSWIPELLFLNSLIGYLIFLIFFKYITVTSDQSKDAPSLLIGLINMIMFKYDTNLPKSQQATLFYGQV
jgi:V-type H+-transporting ATPase subunit a